MNTVMTWRTYKSKFKPIISCVTDSNWGTRSTIAPTLKANGFAQLDEIEYDPQFDCSPMEIVRDYAKNKPLGIVVYCIGHSRNHSRWWIDIYAQSIAERGEIGGTE